MDASGVDAEVVSPMPPLLNYALPVEDGRRLSGAVNEFVARLCGAAPGRLLGLGTVTLQDPDVAAGELTDVRRLGLSGAEIGSDIEGPSLGGGRFGGFFQGGGRVGLAGVLGTPDPPLAH